jgi:hypothetical protein
MKSLGSPRLPRIPALLGMLAACLALGLALAGTASAETVCGEHWCRFEGKIGGGVKTGNGVIGSAYDMISQNEGTATSHCIAPVNWNGSSFVAPYGWKCGGFQVFWEFAPISAMGGEYNNSGGTDKFSNITYYH